MAVNPDRVKKAYDAIDAGDMRTLQLMVRAGVPADYCQPDHSSSLLTRAARNGQLEAFLWLVENGADTNFREACSWREQTVSLVECACGRFGSPAIVGWLLENTVVDRSDLSLALRWLHVKSPTAIDLAEALIRAGADPNFSDDSNETALFNAVCESAEELAILLLKAGASPSIRSKSPYGEKKLIRKTAYEAGQIIGLNRFCTECLNLHPELAEKRPKVPKPKTAAGCWEIISHHLDKYNIRLPNGLGNRSEITSQNYDPSLGLSHAISAARSMGEKQNADVISERFLGDAENHINQLFSIDRDASNQSVDVLIQSWSLHNGSEPVGIFPAANETPYSFMSVKEAIESLAMLREVEAIDHPSRPSLWTTRIPFAENGLGDYFVIELGKDSDCSVLRFSHETTRFRKIAKNFLALLQRTAVDVAEGNLAYDPDANAFT